MTDTQTDTFPELSPESSEGVSTAVLVAAVAGLLAAWLAAGSTGVLAHCFRRALTWAALAVAVAAAWPRGERTGRRVLLLVLGIALALAMTAPRLPASNTLAAALVLAALAVGRSESDRRTLVLASIAVTVLALYRHANTSVPFLWLASDTVGHRLGDLAEEVTGLPMWIGSTFGGLDFLVLMAGLYVGWLVAARPKALDALLVLAALLVGHLLYLCVLSTAPGLLSELPLHAGARIRTPARAVWNWRTSVTCCVLATVFLTTLCGLWLARKKRSRDRELAFALGLGFLCVWAWCAFVYARAFAPDLPAPISPDKRIWPPRSVWFAATALRTVIPWNMLALAGLLHAAVAALMFRAPAPPRPNGDRPRWIPVRTFALIVAGHAALIAVLGTLPSGRSTLAGKKVVVYKEGFLNWLKPKYGDYGRLSIGMYGTLPAHIESLGGKCLISPKLSDADLKDADLLVLIFPDHKWKKGKLAEIGAAIESGKLVVIFPEERWNPNKNRPVRRLQASVKKGTHITVVIDETWGRDRAQLDVIRKALAAEKSVALAPDKTWLREEGLSDRIQAFANSKKIEFHSANDHWDESSDQIDRINSFVESGKTLLVFGEHTTIVDKGAKADEEKPPSTVRDLTALAGTPTWIRPWFEYSAFNEVLEPTATRVVFDSATFEVGGWLQSYEALAHPSTMGVPDDSNEFGVVIGATLRSERPAKPILAGRWGWSDFGDLTAGRSMMGNHFYDPGEQLGDLLLASEQQIGAGRVIAFGDTSGMTNGISIGSYKFTSRLLGYAASDVRGPHGTGRGVVGLIAALILIALLIWRPDPARLATAVVAFSLILVVGTGIAHEAATTPPEGRGLVLRDAEEMFISNGNGVTPRDSAKPPKSADREVPLNNLAYIDNTHAEMFSSESWRPDGTMGVTLNLLRAGYLVRDLDEFTPERLERAGLVLSIAPGREFTRAERETIWNFVDGGGIFIITVGHDDVAPSRRLLADYGLCVGIDFPYEGDYELGVDPGGPRTKPEPPPPPKRHEHRHTHRHVHTTPAGSGTTPPTKAGEPADKHDPTTCPDCLAAAKAGEAADKHDPTTCPDCLAAARAAAPSELRGLLDKKLVLKKRIIEPEPQGHFKSPYFYNNSAKPPYYVFVRFDAAWAVNSVDVPGLEPPRVVANTMRRIPDPDRDLLKKQKRFDQYLNLPVILVRTVGKGKFVLVGDTGFAMNKNLEVQSGWAFEGMRENPDFWRWFLQELRGQERWVPPNPKPKGKAPASDHDGHDHKGGDE